MGFSEAVLWWEEWQLRVLVLCSLFLQFFLCFAGYLRKRQIPSWLRFLIWLAFLGSDAAAIYALATLYNRNKRQEWLTMDRSSIRLQVLWVPILLVHLGGQQGITAYNIEDNELWRRHVLTAGSQATVAIYVFCKSWSGDRNILGTAIILFFYGIAKCLMKVLDLKRVSINNLMDYPCPEDAGGIDTLHAYLVAASQYFQAGYGGQASFIDGGHGVEDWDWCPYDLFVDHAPSYSVRLCCLKRLVHNQQIAHHLVQHGLSVSFDRFYTRKSLLGSRFILYPGVLSCLISFLILLIHMLKLHIDSYTESYTIIDLTITFILLCLIGFLDNIFPGMLKCQIFAGKIPIWPDELGQCNLINYLLARNKKHWKLMTLVALPVDYIYRLLCMKNSKSGSNITKLVHDYVAKGWTEHHIKDIATYRAFNNNRGQWTLTQEGLLDILRWSLQRPFDESVLLWHLATDLCFHFTRTPPSHEAASQCREMSDYMAYLLFVNPEMLIPGARRSLFKATYTGINKFMLNEDPALDGPAANTAPSDENEITIKIVQHAMLTDDGSGIVHGAGKLARVLMRCHSEDEEKMWRVIQGVWVEMLCFSAGRCRGYLHAKSLGTGGEYLSYVWLLLFYMGMETLGEKMQRTELDEGQTAAGQASAAATANHNQNV
ncbi:unnamed protein product [Urochloa decumbens]|uniref:DUF4220 domain-containing protein n=1 Tax=Urochloa decumbens TaxID=240449 RepID=A0ABC9B2X5_9POAL